MENFIMNWLWPAAFEWACILAPCAVIVVIFRVLDWHGRTFVRRENV
jgi:hypothetical protein